MARISKAQKEINLQEVNDAIFECFITGGINNVTMINVAKAWGRQYASAIQVYYKSDELLNGLRGKVFPHFSHFINFNKISTVEAFESAWSKAMLDQGFCHIMSLFISHSMSPRVDAMARAGMLRFTQLTHDKLGDDGLSSLEKMIGKTAIKSCLNDDEYSEFWQ